MHDQVRRRAVVHGRVQGVFFRHSIRERAQAHGVSGWATNRSDGALEAALECLQLAVMPGASTAAAATMSLLSRSGRLGEDAVGARAPPHEQGPGRARR